MTIAGTYELLEESKQAEFKFDLMGRYVISDAGTPESKIEIAHMGSGQGQWVESYASSVEVSSYQSPIRSEAWKSQLNQLPSESRIRKLIPSLDFGELQEVSVGLITDLTLGCRRGDLLQITEDLNGWVATAEEYLEYRARRQEILRAREDTQDDIEI